MLNKMDYTWRYLQSLNDHNTFLDNIINFTLEVCIVLKSIYLGIQHTIISLINHYYYKQSLNVITVIMRN